ncbi:MAG: RNA-binding protein [Mycobacterium sp.]|nr:RNA-binding protein [Mycobacterium sp.]
MPSTPTQWPGDAEAKPAPDPLLRVQALVNTLDREAGTDRLGDPADARPWLVTSGLLSSSADLKPADLRLVRNVREGLRALLVHNAGGPAPSADAVAALRAVTEDSPAVAELGDDGVVRLGAAGDSVRGRLLELLLIIKDAQHDGSWARLKACANEDCLWAFYDRSRNHGGAWCDMAACGNKLKNRDFRARRRSGAPSH